MIKKKILFVEHCNTGGLAHYAHDCCSAMVRNGGKVTLICLGQFEVPERQRSYDVIESSIEDHTTRISKGLQNLKFIYHVVMAIRKTVADVVFFNGYQPILSWPLTFLRLRKIPIFCIQHEIEPRIGEKRISFFQRDFYNRVTAMIVHRNTHSKKLLEKKYQVRTPILTIDLGLYATDLFGKETAGNNLTKTTILSFGSVRPDKGLDLLVKAYPGRNQCDGLWLEIAGQAKGEYGNCFAKMVAEKIDVIWNRNFIPSLEIGNIYKKAAFVVFPFLECTQSASLRLAMFFETPIIATNVGEIPVFIEKYRVGILVPRGDIQALRQAMITMAINRNKRDEYVANIKKLNSSSELSWQAIIEELFSEIKERKLW